METLVLIHGAWHDASAFKETSQILTSEGYSVHTPTILGNKAGDPKDIGLEDAISSIVSYVVENDLVDIILCGHSYGGMIITGVADKLEKRIKRLIYWNAFVPTDGESLESMVGQPFIDLADKLTEPDGSFMLPFEIWREHFVNNASYEIAENTYSKLNPHPRKTFSQPIKLTKNPSEFDIGKSYINCLEDTALPQSEGWHPRLSEKLGLFRLIQISGDHEACYTSPTRLGQAIIKAARS